MTVMDRRRFLGALPAISASAACGLTLGAPYDRQSMRYRKEDLLVPEALLKRRLEFLRSEYDCEHARAEPKSK